ncbi:MAG: RNA methyltransferase [Pseudomonadota bacterium]
MLALDKVRIVLVRTFHPGNIGSAARSMKTMGLSDLCLVNPKDFPSPEANKMAAGAEDMLGHVRMASSVSEAIKDCTVVVASTARIRGYDLPELQPEQAAEMLVTGSQSSPVALIFGPERMGLHNEDIQYARYRVTIPANPEYNSLNLAAAVQTLSYELFKAASDESILSKKAQRELPPSEDIERLHIHLEKVLKDIRFLRPHQGETLQRIRNLLARAEPDVQELNILRGILAAIEKSLTN